MGAGCAPDIERASILLTSSYKSSSFARGSLRVAITGSTWSHLPELMSDRKASTLSTVLRDT